MNKSIRESQSNENKVIKKHLKTNIKGNQAIITKIDKRNTIVIINKDAYIEKKTLNH